MSTHPSKSLRHLAAALCACGLLAVAAGAGADPARPAATDSGHALALTDPATVLFDWAERAFPAYFPGHRQNQSLPPYVYRFYPETGIYLAVADGKVYALGGPAGAQLVDLGLVTDFVSLSPQQPAGTGNGCWDRDFLETTGRQVLVESRTTAAGGALTGGLTQEWKVLGPRAFEGASRLATETTVTQTLPSGVVVDVQVNTSYTQRAAGGSVTMFGDEGSMTAGPAATAFRTVFSPPWTDAQYLLQPGQSVAQSWTGTTTTQGVSSPLQGSRTIRFVGRETIDVPAGRFETCRFEQSQPSSPTFTSWVAVGWGVPVRLQSASGGSTATTEAMRVLVDGVPIGGVLAAAALRPE